MIPLVVLLSSTLGSLLELARIPVLSRRQRDDAVSLMKELRREGFTNRDLAVLVGNRWKEPTIKKFTRGVKVRSTAERDVVLETFSRFTSAGKTLKDVEDYLAVSNHLDSQQLSFETITTFIIEMTSQKFNLITLTNLYWEIEEQEYTVADISGGLEVLRSLKLEGISIDTMKELKEMPEGLQFRSHGDSVSGQNVKVYTISVDGTQRRAVGIIEGTSEVKGNIIVNLKK